MSTFNDFKTLPQWLLLVVFFLALVTVTPAYACPPGAKCLGVIQAPTNLATVTYQTMSGAVDPERIFHNGEKLWMVATIQQTGYVYLVNVDSASNVALVFPYDGESNYVIAGGTVPFGTEASPLQINPPFGQEDLYLVYSRTPLDTLALNYIVARESQQLGRNHVQLVSASSSTMRTKSISATRSVAPTAATYSFDPTAEGAQVAYIRMMSAQ